MTSPLFFFFFFFITPTLAANSSAISYEIEPFIRVYRNGRVERLMGTETVPPSLDPKSGVISKDLIIDPSLNISARFFLPKQKPSRRKIPLLVYFHGGAFFTGSPFSATYHNYINSVAAAAKAAVLSVNYRLAPEHPLPAAYHDSYLSLKWALSRPWLKSHVDLGRVYLSGDSAGGNIAHNVAMRAGLEGVRVRGLFLNCPHFWGKVRIGKEAKSPKMVAIEDSIWIHAYPNSGGLDDPKLNPELDPNLGRLGCDKVVVYVAGEDVLRDRGLAYTKALERSQWGGLVKAVDVKGAAHVFNLNNPNTTDSRRMLHHFALFLNDKAKFY